MKQFAVILILVFNTLSLFAQNLDSLYNEFISSRNFTEVAPLPSEIPGDNINGTLNNKCGFNLNGIIRRHFNSFSSDQQNILSKILSRPSLDTSIVSQSGKFRIHFDKSGSSKPRYAGINIPPGGDSLKITIDSVAAVFDYVYNYEVNVLGYPPAPVDNGIGGDDLYDVYIINLGGSFYGETVFENELGGDKYSTFLRVDNDFINYYTKGFDALKVTAAHEYHHAIQVGNYLFRDADTYYYELCSTAMEEFLYDEINDYYAYMNGYFNNPARAFNSGSGYDFAIWNLFLQKRLGFDVLKRTWEIMAENIQAINAVSSAIFEFNSTFKDEMNLFGQHIYFTKYRSENSTIFDEAENYPLLQLSKPYTDSRTVTVNSNQAANNYLSFAISNGMTTDTIVTVITNSDPINKITFDYTFLTASESGAFKIINNYFYKFSSDNPGMLKQSNIFNNDFIINDIEKSEIEFPFPQPFSYANNNNIYIPVAQSITGEATLNVYSISMNLVYSGSLYILSGNKIKIKWNGLDKNNEKLPTGVYIYVTKSDDTIKKGKIVIYNE
ncbi:MAG: hypothetical protein KJ571_07590 [Bacteroidetes bacterium]|nr:hypothetical protein [Bacteroidota bacterium]